MSNVKWKWCDGRIFHKNTPSLQNFTNPFFRFYFKIVYKSNDSLNKNLQIERLEIINWCIKNMNNTFQVGNLKSTYLYSITYYDIYEFTDGEDAMLFKLAWAEFGSKTRKNN